MPASIKPANVDSFISYSRVDADFARLFYVRLQESGFRLWRDRSEMEGGQNWFQQILSTIEQVDTLILCLSPAAIKSPNVADEWRHARRVGTRVIPVIAADVDFNSMPRWMKKVDWLDFRKSRLFNPTLTTTDAEQDLAWERFIHQLKTPDQPLKVPYTNPLLKKTFVQRPKLYDSLKAMLLQETQPEAVAITTTALSGGGGFGKTTLAIALCCDEDIRNRYDDGILWIEFGETPDVLTLLTNQIRLLSSEPLTVTSINAVAARFRQLIEKRDMLLVLDDIWSEESVRLFLESAPTCTRLITTRRLDVTARLNVKNPVAVNDMETAEATQLLLKLIDSPVDNLTLVSELTALLGEYPLMLGLAGAYLRDVMLNDVLSLTEAINTLRAQLTEYGYTAFDHEDAGGRNASLHVSLNVSIERLGKWKDRYLELAIFPEDANIPLATLAQLWGATGGLKMLAVEDAYKMMHRLSLFTEYDVQKKTVRLHDVVRHYLEQRQGEKKLCELHDTLLSRYACENWADLPENEPYLWDQLAYHLHGAARDVELATTVKNGVYLVRKTHLRGTAAVEHDLMASQTYLPADSSLAQLARSYNNAAHLLNHGATEQDMSHILYQRTQHLEEMRACWAPLPPTWYKPYIDLNLAVPQPLPDLPHPALIRTLEGHTSSVNSGVYSSDGCYILSASNDGTLKVWDAASGALCFTLDGHTQIVNSGVYSPDGRHILSASDDGTLKVWDAASGALCFTLDGHTQTVNSGVYSPDGRHILSASNDGTLKVWDATSGALCFTLDAYRALVRSGIYSPDRRHILSASDDAYTLRVWDSTNSILRLDGHTQPVNSGTYSPDGRYILSASVDQTLKVWDAASGALCFTLDGHTSSVSSGVYSPDGRHILSASWDKTLKVWDATSGNICFTLEGHTDTVNSGVYSPDGCHILSASDDGKLKVWDAASGTPQPTIPGHTEAVRSGIYSPDGRHILSVSNDGTLKVWDAASGSLQLALDGHTEAIRSGIYSPDGRHILSASHDGTLKVWDATSAILFRTLNGHTAWVNSGVYSLDGRHILSASGDKTLKVWDAASGILQLTLEGHTEAVLSGTYSPDGRHILSASWDKTLKVWDAASGTLQFTLQGHKYGVDRGVYSPDGRHILSVSWDQTLKVWDAANGSLLHTLDGHTDKVNSGVYSPNGRHILSVSWDQTLKVWDATSGSSGTRSDIKVL